MHTVHSVNRDDDLSARQQYVVNELICSVIAGTRSLRVRGGQVSDQALDVCCTAMSPAMNPRRRFAGSHSDSKPRRTRDHSQHPDFFSEAGSRVI